LKKLPSEDDRKKRRRWWDEDFNNQFEAIQRMFEEIIKTFTDKSPEDLFGPDAQEQFEEILRELQKNPMVWGFSAAIGPDGRIKLNPFGNLNPQDAPPVVQEQREPLIEVMDQDEVIIIIAEIPGVKEEDIQLDISNNQVTINIDAPNRKYAKTIDLPATVNHEVAEVHYANGILEVQIPKKSPTQQL
jgi:HSP20 family protein